MMTRLRGQCCESHCDYTSFLPHPLSTAVASFPTSPGNCFSGMTSSYDLVKPGEIISCINISIWVHVEGQVLVVGEALYGLSYDSSLSQLWETPSSLSSLLRCSPVQGAGLKVTLLIGDIGSLGEGVWQSRAEHYHVEDRNLYPVV